MVPIRNAQSLTTFLRNPDETLARIESTGEATMLKVKGKARAVLLTPSMYDDLAYEALLAYDAEIVLRSIRELDEGKGEDLDVAFDRIRKRVLARTSRRQGARKRK